MRFKIRSKRSFSKSEGEKRENIKATTTTCLAWDCCDDDDDVKSSEMYL
jgi:hypothetical protein